MLRNYNAEQYLLLNEQQKIILPILCGNIINISKHWFPQLIYEQHLKQPLSIITFPYLDDDTFNKKYDTDEITRIQLENNSKRSYELITHPLYIEGIHWIKTFENEPYYLLHFNPMYEQMDLEVHTSHMTVNIYLYIYIYTMQSDINKQLNHMDSFILFYFIFNLFLIFCFVL
jgi:hypothetical protein